MDTAAGRLAVALFLTSLCPASLAQPATGSSDWPALAARRLPVLSPCDLAEARRRSQGTVFGNERLERQIEG